MFDPVFKVIYLAEFILITIIRKYFTARLTKERFTQKDHSKIDTLFLVLAGIGMITPLFYIFTDWLEFADYTLPEWIGWLGSLLFLMATWLLYRSHADLGKNWTPVIGVRETHSLVTTGIYKYIRHPMYAAHILWSVAQIMMLPNWIAGFSFIIVMIPHYFLRVDKEENMMIEQFGEEYHQYKQKTGRVFPRF